MNEVNAEKGLLEPGDSEDTLPILSRPEQSENVAFLRDMERNKSSTLERYSWSCLWAEIKYV